jgi:hypothetical protein
MLAESFEGPDRMPFEQPARVEFGPHYGKIYTIELGGGVGVRK